MATNYHLRYFAALDALIVAEGGTIPTQPHANPSEAEIAKLEALAVAVGGIVPSNGDDVLKRYAAAILALGGAVPTAWLNHREAVIQHARALQESRGRTVPPLADAPTNYYENLLLILEA